MNTPPRTCDSCTECCQGHLKGQAHGHNFHRGTPCFFVGTKGCSIYADRPVDPCVNFQCEWVSKDYLPMWFRPDLSKVIVVNRQQDDGEWLEISETSQKIDSAILSWLVLWALNNKKNIRYQVDCEWHWIKNAVT